MTEDTEPQLNKPNDTPFPLPDSPTVNTVNIEDIIIPERQRKDYGDVSSLARSIKRFGLIQPCILQSGQMGMRNLSDGGTDTERRPILVAGGRRLCALKSIGFDVLRHGKEFVWRDEDFSTPEGTLRVQTMELEENIRRKDLTWQETITAKLTLFRTMQSIKGVGKGFGTGGFKHDGFSLRMLAEMLDENPSTTSRDLELAGYVEKHPGLAAMPTRADAWRKLGVAVTVASMQRQASAGASALAVTDAPASAGTGVTSVAPSPPNVTPGVTSLSQQQQTQQRTTTDTKWVLYEGKFQDNISVVSDGSVDLICTDLPYNIGLGNSTASHSAGLGSFSDSNLDIVDLCAAVALESYRVLRDNRFAVFFYGMNYHEVLYDALTTAGFSVDPYPFIWLRDRTAPPDGFARYSKTYDPAFIASKGVPRFIRPNLPNTTSIPSVRGPERLHAAQKPVAVMQKFIEDMTVANCVVLDMFAGAGTTGEAALRTGRKAILFELEANNCILIRSRLGVM